MDRPSTLVIVGGGTAGWMAANIVLHALPHLNVSLIESSHIGTIGVGEGSTPFLKQFFRRLNIADHEWMPQCHASYKAGIRFPGWRGAQAREKGEPDSYFHPFFSVLDTPSANAFFAQVAQRQQGQHGDTHPDHYFLANEIAMQQRAPLYHGPEREDMDYGYHFDAGLLADFLKQRALQQGLTHITDTVLGCECNAEGDIAALTLQTRGRYAADFYIDCSGFRALLIEQGLKIPFIEFGENLFNDAAVAIGSLRPTDAPIQAETVSQAMSAGWAWAIPLQHRIGNGYVYSRAHLSAEQAERELREQLGPQAETLPARHLNMRIGRRTRHWHRNCLAVGLSQGFIEPLEATALMLVQLTLVQFVTELSQHGNAPDAQDRCNQEVNRMFDGVRDYIVAHYKLNGRSDSDYWIDAREHAPVSDTLGALMEAWDSGQFEDALQRYSPSLAYLRPSWYVLFSGMGRFSEHAGALRTPTRHPERTQFVQQHYPDHLSALRQMTAQSP